MPIAAVPKYLGQDFKTASPGMRFGMYLKLWGINRRTEAWLWEMQDVDYEVRGQDRQEREVSYDNKVSALSDAKRLNDTDKKTMLALLERQESTFKTIASASSIRLDARAIAPFTTGLGNEHPLENGFAFLNPYGLPYLPGSGVKGVLRQAARELAGGDWGEPRGWSEEKTYSLGGGKDERIELSMIDVLFGREAPSGDSDRVRGALTFWDVIPQIAGDSLMVEIMTPHQSHYYQQKQAAGSTTPHDSGQPNPICFLTVPPGSSFVFHVVCDPAHLQRLTAHRGEGAPDLLADGPTHWKKLLEAAFQHAFTWLGFGAKTAVGYGAMKRASAAEPSDTNPPAGSPSPAPLDPDEWDRAKLVWDKGKQEMSAVFGGKKTAPVKKAETARALFADPALFDRLVKKGELAQARVLVRIDGNMIELKRVL